MTVLRADYFHPVLVSAVWIREEQCTTSGSWLHLQLTRQISHNPPANCLANAPFYWS
ncbi:hypothetical protein OH492_21050 [Vibrio chagasii]|nr:hypothetical protein [Vibrio chagasii]